MPMIAEDGRTISLPFHNDTYQFGNYLFYLEKAFNTNATNAQIYQEVAANLISSALVGYNCCIFAYGQTSSGKTHTIRGSEKEQGIIKYAL